MRLVSFNLEILQFPPVNLAPLLALDLQLGERPGLALQLLPERVDVVEVDVRVAHDVGETARHHVADVGEHVRQQRVAGDIERDAQAHIAGTLVQLAVQVAPGLDLRITSIRSSPVCRR